MKPLIRWTMGPTRPEGFACLRASVNRIRELYPECDLVICYNQLDDNQLSEIQSIDVPMHNQEQDAQSLQYTPTQGYQVHWKLYPPRLRINAPEILIDNDIVLLKRVPEIDHFLDQGDECLLYQGLHGLHGQFEDHVPQGFRINSGIYGMPNGYDFATDLRSLLQEIPNWNDRFDEQGAVATCLLQQPKHIIIPLTTVPIIEDWMPIEPFLKNTTLCGIHFVGVNYRSHTQWLNFRALRTFI